jgi:hypothetical protein
VLATCPTAQPSWYDGVGHTTFLEDPTASTTNWPR